MAPKAKAQAAGTDATPSGSHPANGGTPSKTEAVREAIRNGMTSPSEIAAHLQKQYGMRITPGHVSEIQKQSKEGGNGRKRRGRRGRRAKAAAAPAEPQTAPRPRPSGGLSVEGLNTLLQLAKSVGGIGELRHYLDMLGRFQG